MKFYTPEEYVSLCIDTYPTLYTGRALYESRMKVFDQLFNVIGNGIRDNKELKQELKFRGKVVSDPYKWILNDIWYGYKEIKEVNLGNGKTIKFPRGESSSYFLEEEKKDHPEILYWVKSEKYPFAPYPNFQKRYSTVWQCSDFVKLGNKWITVAIQFYKYCKEWFNEENWKLYHEAYPKETLEKTSKVEQDYLNAFFRYGYTSNEEISKAYEFEYNGNIQDFLTGIWEVEKERIFSFIDETISMLEAHLK